MQHKLVGNILQQEFVTKVHGTHSLPVSIHRACANPCYSCKHEQPGSEPGCTSGASASRSRCYLRHQCQKVAVCELMTNYLQEPLLQHLSKQTQKQGHTKSVQKVNISVASRSTRSCAHTAHGPCDMVKSGACKQQRHLHVICPLGPPCKQRRQLPPGGSHASAFVEHSPGKPVNISFR